MTTFAQQARTAFREFVLDAAFPCLGAKASFNSGSETLCVFDTLAGEESTTALAEALRDFTRLVGRDSVEPAPLAKANVRGSTESRPTEYATFVAIFERPTETDEIEFERLLWKQLRLLHKYDRTQFAWDDGVAADPADPHFSFSFAGQALYIVGLHANSSRQSRRFPWPTLVFNPHEQFQRLRNDGKWQRVKETIRQRDLELQGTINPMLSDFGEQSEARQYSGRSVEKDWQAPFPKAAPKCPFAH